jgi:hypothetical protein
MRISREANMVVRKRMGAENTRALSSRMRGCLVVAGVWFAGAAVIACTFGDLAAFTEGNSKGMNGDAGAGTIGHPGDGGGSDDAPDGEPEAGGRLEDAADDGADGESDAADGATKDASIDSGPPGPFGTSCPTGTAYTDSFASDPVVRGTWTLLAGSYTYEPGSVTLNFGSPNTQMWIGPRPAWRNYSVSVPITLGPNTDGLNAGIDFRMESVPNANPIPVNSGEMYFAVLQPNAVVLGTQSGGDGSVWSDLQSAAGTFTSGTPYTLQVSVSGSTINVSVNGTLYIQNDVNAMFTFGSIGLATYNCSATYGKITVTCN